MFLNCETFSKYVILLLLDSNPCCWCVNTIEDVNGNRSWCSPISLMSIDRPSSMDDSVDEITPLVAGGDTLQSHGTRTWDCVWIWIPLVPSGFWSCWSWRLEKNIVNRIEKLITVQVRNDIMTQWHHDINQWHHDIIKSIGCAVTTTKRWLKYTMTSWHQVTMSSST